MKKFLMVVALLNILAIKAFANSCYSDVSTANIPPMNETRRYNTEDGGYYVVRINNQSYTGVFNVYWSKYDANGTNQSATSRDFNYALNGSPFCVGWGRTVLNFDEHGNFLGELNGWEQNGQTGGAATTSLIAASDYSDEGKVLNYNGSEQLIGAYNDFFDYIAQKNINQNYVKLDLRDSDGNYYETDSHGNVTDVYYQNGTKGNHNDYKYDGAGNITEKYENGKLVYAKKIYTPAEAAAAVKDGNNNTVSITW